MATNYDRIRDMSVEEIAILFYSLIHERDLYLLNKLKREGIEASLVEGSPEAYIAYHKQWLESEVE